MPRRFFSFVLAMSVVALQEVNAAPPVRSPPLLITSQAQFVQEALSFRSLWQLKGPAHKRHEVQIATWLLLWTPHLFAQTVQDHLRQFQSGDLVHKKEAAQALGAAADLDRTLLWNVMNTLMKVGLLSDDAQVRKSSRDALIVLSRSYDKPGDDEAAVSIEKMFSRWAKGNEPIEIRGAYDLMVVEVNLWDKTSTYATRAGTMSNDVQVNRYNDETLLWSKFAHFIRALRLAPDGAELTEQWEQMAGSAAAYLNVHAATPGPHPFNGEEEFISRIRAMAMAMRGFDGHKNPINLSDRLILADMLLGILNQTLPERAAIDGTRPGKLFPNLGLAAA